MSRPKFLNCVMTPNIIRSIREKQSSYDENPELYERREQENKERLRMEQEQEYLEQQRQQEE